MEPRRTRLHERRIFVQHFTKSFKISKRHGVGCAFEQEIRILTVHRASLPQLLFDRVEPRGVAGWTRLMRAGLAPA